MGKRLKLNEVCLPTKFHIHSLITCLDQVPDEGIILILSVNRIRQAETYRKSKDGQSYRHASVGNPRFNLQHRI